MPRIRSVKPEFWNDEKLANISVLSRLVYIGVWNFSDDYGVVKGNPMWLKNSIFPYNDIDIRKFTDALNELINIRRLLPFNYNGESYYFIPTFKIHQHVNNPSKFKNPQPPNELLSEDSVSVPLPIPLGEGKVKEKERKSKNLSPVKFDDEIHQLVSLFCLTLGKERQIKPKERDEWLDCIDKLHRIDKYSYFQIADIIDYFRQDEYWIDKFTTILKLRKLNKEKQPFVLYFWEKLKAQGFEDGPADSGTETSTDYIKAKIETWELK